MGNAWTGYSPAGLEAVQDKVIALVEKQCLAENRPVKFVRKHTDIGPVNGEARTLHSIECESVEASEAGRVAGKPPIIVCHGYMAGSLLFANTLVALALRTERPVIALDWLGCGGSARPAWSAKNEREALGFFIESFEAWREKREIERFDLVGHSLGGYLAAHYLDNPVHARRVDHLVLASPVGFPRAPEMPKDLPWQFRVLFYLWEAGLNPNHVIRGTGPLGRRFVQGFVDRRFGDRTLGIKGLVPEEHDALMVDYIHHISAAPASGEHALGHLLAPGAFARIDPLVDVLPRAPDRKTLIVFGDQDWMARDIHAAHEAAVRLRNAKVLRIPGSHHVYLSGDAFEDPVIAFLQA